MCLGITVGPQPGVSPSASTEISLMGGILDDIKVPCVVLHESSVFSPPSFLYQQESFHPDFKIYNFYT